MVHGEVSEELGPLVIGGFISPIDFWPPKSNQGYHRIILDSIKWLGWKHWGSGQSVQRWLLTFGEDQTSFCGEAIVQDLGFYLLVLLWPLGTWFKDNAIVMAWALTHKWVLLEQLQGIYFETLKKKIVNASLWSIFTNKVTLVNCAHRHLQRKLLFTI